MRFESVPILLAFAAVSSAACRVVGPEQLIEGVPAIDAGTTLDVLATPGKGIPLPATCKVAPSTVTPMTRVVVTAGEFAMGCNPKTDTECQDDENPEHMVSVDAFSIDVTEVTQAQYALCVASGVCTLPYCAWDACTAPNLPIACVYREQAMDYCAFVGEELPTEAQWEKAARGTDGRKYPWGNADVACDLANLSGCGDGGVLSVGSLPHGASPYGALDMAGNVVEWTLDVYDSSYYARSPLANPSGPGATTASSFVGRGGGWRSDDSWQRAGARDSYDPLYVRDSMGFRCSVHGAT